MTKFYQYTNFPHHFKFFMEIFMSISSLLEGGVVITRFCLEILNFNTKLDRSLNGGTTSFGKVTSAVECGMIWAQIIGCLSNEETKELCKTSEAIGRVIVLFTDAPDALAESVQARDHSIIVHRLAQNIVAIARTASESSELKYERELKLSEEKFAQLQYPIVGHKTDSEGYSSTKIVGSYHPSRKEVEENAASSRTNALAGNLLEALFRFFGRDLRSDAHGAGGRGARPPGPGVGGAGAGGGGGGGGGCGGGGVGGTGAAPGLDPFRAADFLSRDVIPDEIADDPVFQRNICPITHLPIRHAVRDPHGHIFERDSINAWVDEQGTCPIGRQPLTRAHLTPATDIQTRIDNRLRYYQHAVEEVIHKVQLQSPADDAGDGS